MYINFLSERWGSTQHIGKFQEFKFCHLFRRLQVRMYFTTKASRLRCFLATISSNSWIELDEVPLLGNVDLFGGQGTLNWSCIGPLSHILYFWTVPTDVYGDLSNMSSINPCCWVLGLAEGILYACMEPRFGMVGGQVHNHPLGSNVSKTLKGNWWNLLLTQMDYVILFCKCEIMINKTKMKYFDFSWLLKRVLPE